MNVKQIEKKWQGLGAKVEAVAYAQTGYDYDVTLTPESLHGFAEVMLAEGFYLVDLMAVHVKPAIEVVYQFAHFGGQRCRVMGRTFVDAQGALPTISDVFQGANWHEREARDFHGVVFAGHPNLQPLILAEEDVDLKPLLKDEKVLKDVAAIRRQVPEAEAPAAEKAAKPEAAN
ncbi:MAG: NADH-quinone oxidoreductase subunit C [Desulfuromonadaceae bacterium]|nr:NADH-quinone oxidoreductase subunit C [Desulfuromonadaceae bacterium]